MYCKKLSQTTVIDSHMQKLPLQLKQSLRLLLICTGLISSSNIFAQAKNFEGFDINITTGVTPMRYSSTVENTPNVTVQKDPTNSTPAIASVGYSVAVSDNFVLSGSFNYELFKSKQTSVNIYANGALLPSAGKSQGLQNLEGFSLKVGKVIQASTLVYTKIGTSSAVQYGTNNDGSAFTSSQIKYTIYGIGFRELLTPNVFVLGEIDYNKMTDTSTNKTIGRTSYVIDGYSDGYGLLIGLGYKF